MQPRGWCWWWWLDHRFSTSTLTITGAHQPTSQPGFHFEWGVGARNHYIAYAMVTYGRAHNLDFVCASGILNATPEIKSIPVFSVWAGHTHRHRPNQDRVSERERERASESEREGRVNFSVMTWRKRVKIVLLLNLILQAYDTHTHTPSHTYCTTPLGPPWPVGGAAK